MRNQNKRLEFGIPVISLETFIIYFILFIKEWSKRYLNKLKELNREKKENNRNLIETVEFVCLN